MTTDRRLVPESAFLLETWRDDEGEDVATEHIALVEVLENLPEEDRGRAVLSLSMTSSRARLALQWERLETDAEWAKRTENEEERLKRQAARKALTDPIHQASIERREREQLAMLQAKYGVTETKR